MPRAGEADGAGRPGAQGQGAVGESGLRAGGADGVGGARAPVERWVMTESRARVRVNGGQGMGRDVPDFVF